MAWRGICGLVVGFLLWAGLRPAAADPLPIRISYTVPALELISLFGQKTDILKHYGKSYTVELIRFRGTSPMITAFAAGQLDLGNLAYSSFALAVLNAGLDLRILAEDLKSGVPGHFADKWAVREDSDIKTVADLRGKTIGINAFGTAVDLALRVMLKKHGLLDKRDYRIVEVAFPHQEAMLRQGKIDAACLVQPFWSIASRKGGIRPIFDVAQAMGPTQLVFLVGRTAFLQQHREVVQDFFTDFLIFWRWMLDPAHREEAVRLAAAFTKRPEAAFADWFLTAEDYYRDPDGLVDAAMLQGNVDVLYEMGFIPRRLDLRPYLDLSFVREAKKRLAGQ
ncbi:MAG: nitrate ABC transporter substrate-binding protein [Candidatus Tectimicrobiota bacterium]|nr:MAG: nitrate ABC transporter substrate-binding protein [Candidatus Tectomicrobia bacterium]